MLPWLEASDTYLHLLCARRPGRRPVSNHALNSEHREGRSHGESFLLANCQPPGPTRPATPVSPSSPRPSQPKPVLLSPPLACFRLTPATELLQRQGHHAPCPTACSDVSSAAACLRITLHPPPPAERMPGFMPWLNADSWPQRFFAHLSGGPELGLCLSTSGPWCPGQVLTQWISSPSQGQAFWNVLCSTCSGPPPKVWK